MHKLKNELKQPAQETNQTPKLIRIKSVIELTGLSKSYVYDLSTRNLFPKSVQLVPGGTSVAWLESEIQKWIASRVQERDEGGIKSV
jgi:prophage regulatory protein